MSSQNLLKVSLQPFQAITALLLLLPLVVVRQPQSTLQTRGIHCCSSTIGTTLLQLLRELLVAVLVLVLLPPLPGALTPLPQRPHLL